MAVEWAFKRGDAVIVSIPNPHNRFSIAVENAENDVWFWNRINKHKIAHLEGSIKYVGARVGAGYQLLDNPPEPGKYVVRDESWRVTANVMTLATDESIENFEFVRAKQTFWSEVDKRERERVDLGRRQARR